MPPWACIGGPGNVQVKTCPAEGPPALLQSARFAGTPVAEAARIGRLAGVATVGGQSRINAAMGPAMILATLGLP